jgi:hypothetical protein
MDWQTYGSEVVRFVSEVYGRAPNPPAATHLAPSLYKLSLCILLYTARFTCRGERKNITSGARPTVSSDFYFRRSVDVFYPTGIIVDVSVKLPTRVSNILLSGFRII